MFADIDSLCCPSMSEEFLGQLPPPCIVLKLSVGVPVVVITLQCVLVKSGVNHVRGQSNVRRARLCLNTLFRERVGRADPCEREGATACVLWRVICAIVLVPAYAVVVTFVLKNTRRKTLEPRSHRDRDIQQRK